MDYDEALAWLEGKRSSVNWFQDVTAEGQINVARYDAATTERAYWTVRAYKEGLIGEAQLVPADARVVSGEDVETIAETICRIDNTTGADVAVEGVPCDLHRSVARAVLADLGVYPSKTEPPKDPWDYEP